MKIETQPIEGHQVQLTVEVEAAAMDEAKIKAARKIARKIKIPGFRPGKAPFAMVQRVAGDEAIIEEAIEILVDEVYPQVIKDSGIEPFGPGRLNDIKSQDPLVFEFVVPLKANTVLGDYKSVSLPYVYEGVGEAQVDEVVQRLRSQQAVVEKVDRPAAEGDLVVVKISAEKAGDAEDKNLITGSDYTIEIKSESSETSNEWPFPGFSRRLDGMSAGDAQKFDYQFPEDYVYENLKGVQANFVIQVNEVKSRVLPEANDELAQSVGEFENMDALRDAILLDLQTESEREYNEEYDQKVIEEIIAMSTINYPERMLDQETEDVIRQLGSRLEQQGMDLELYLKTRKMDMDALKAETRPVAEKRLKRTLTLLELAEQEQIKVDPDELQAETTRTLDRFSQLMPEKDFKKLIAGGGTSTLVSNIMMDMVIDKTLRRIRSIASGINMEPVEDTPEHEGEPIELSESIDPTITDENIHEVEND